MKREPYERLREARQRAGLSGPAETAHKFGWNFNTYKSHENGIRGFKTKTAEKYGKAFHVTAAWLLTEEGDGAPSLTSDERRVLEKFRILSPQHRKTVLDMCDSLIQAEAASRPLIAVPARRRKA